MGAKSRFPEANQLLICPKPQGLNPSQTLANVLAALPHCEFTSPSPAYDPPSPPPLHSLLFLSLSSCSLRLIMLFKSFTYSSKYETQRTQKIPFTLMGLCFWSFIVKVGWRLSCERVTDFHPKVVESTLNGPEFISLGSERSSKF